jgi:galactokinase
MRADEREEPGALVEASAPGRVNLIGDHTDYVGGFALPMAIDRRTTVRGRRVAGRVHLRSADDPAPVHLQLHELAAADAIEPFWGRYVAAVARELHDALGLDGSVSTTVPIGAGLSSSAALEVAVALALGADLPPLELAQACQRAEHAASGVPCGLMDQLVALLGIEGHALLIDFRAVTWEAVTVPEHLAFVVVDSGERRSLASSAYGQRRAEVAEAERAIGPLRDAAPADLAAVRDPAARARARHVLTENERVLAFVDALRAEDPVAMGQILNASYRSNRDDFDASTPIVDALIARLVAHPGVYGARLMGGGFGGCVLALAEPGALDEGWRVRPAAGASLAS